MSEVRMTAFGFLLPVPAARCCPSLLLSLPSLCLFLCSCEREGEATAREIQTHRARDS